MSSSNTLPTKPTYPWTHLFSSSVLANADIVDFAEVARTKKRLKEKEKQIEEMAQKHSIDTKHQAHAQQEHDKLLTNMKAISSDTFDKLTQQVEDQRLALVALEEENAALNEELKKTEAQQSDELTAAILTQMVVAHSKKLEGKEFAQSVTKDTYRWLSQRTKVLKYMEDNQLLPDYEALLEEVLFTKKETIIAKVKELTTKLQANKKI